MPCYLVGSFVFQNSLSALSNVSLAFNFSTVYVGLFHLAIKVDSLICE